MDTETYTVIREVLRDQNLDAVDELADDEDLFDAGLSSLTAVHLILTLEGRLGVIFPEQGLTRDNLRSIIAIAALVETARAGEPA
jgi:acyl carrier protein